jgi:hypothetical protein
MFVDSAAARVAPAAATDPRAVPALIVTNLLRTTPSVPMGLQNQCVPGHKDQSDTGNM